MLLSFIYLIFVSLLKLLIRSGRPAQIKDIELIVLRHQLKVLRCQVGALLLAAFAFSVAFFMHAFWREQDARMRQNQMAHFMKNMALVGAALESSG